MSFGRRSRRGLILPGAISILLLSTLAAAAHPHVFVSATATVVFNAQNQMQNMEDLAEYKYFTVLKSGRALAAFQKPQNYSAELKSGTQDLSLVLHFTLPLEEPLAVPREATLQVYDPSYFTAFSFADTNPISLTGADLRCQVQQAKAKPLNPADQASLTKSFFTNMLPGTDFGIKLADSIHIACKS